MAEDKTRLTNLDLALRLAHPDWYQFLADSRALREGMRKNAIPIGAEWRLIMDLTTNWELGRKMFGPALYTEFMMSDQPADHWWRDHLDDLRRLSDCPTINPNIDTC